MCLLAGLTPGLFVQVQAAPVPGDVFREYFWRPHGTRVEPYHVLTLNQSPIEIPGALDLTDAIKSEVVLEMGSAHLGYEGIGVQVNGHQWKPITYPSLASPDPSLYFHQWWPTVSLPITDFKPGTGNTVTLKIGATSCDGKWPNASAPHPHPPYNPVYSIIVRIYYNAHQKPHPTGHIVTPKSGDTIGTVTTLGATAVSRNARIAQVDFIGHYEDVNYEGDGVYEQWHYVMESGKIVHHLGSTNDPGKTVSWNTSWVPDQIHPLQILARVTDDKGLIYMTKPVTRLHLVRPGLSVELSKPYDVPKAFTSCQVGVYVTPGPKAEKFTVKGNLAKATDARFAVSCWIGTPGYGFTVNDVNLEDSKVTTYNRWHHLFVMELRPLTAIKVGPNSFGVVPAPDKSRSIDIHWPGAAVLIRYKK